MVVHVVDPPAYTPPYDHLLCEALAEAGATVHLITSPPRYGPAPLPHRYLRHELFYRSARSRAAKLAAHLPDLAAYLRLARPEILHFQWLAVQPLDLLALSLWRPRPRPRLVLTAHDLLPREGLPGQALGQRLAYRRFDKVVVHSRYGEQELLQLGLPKEKLARIPHPVLRPNLAPGEVAQLPAELPAPDGPIALFPGILRPYKGLDLLFAAWRAILPRVTELGAELWVCGHPRIPLAKLQAALPPRARLVPRFLAEGELAALLETATVVVLPYRKLDSSGVALLAVGLAKPLLVSDAGSFPELAALGVARAVPSGQVEPLAEALAELLENPAERQRLEAAARQAAAGPLSPKPFGASHLALYSSLLGDG